MAACFQEMLRIERCGAFFFMGGISGAASSEMYFLYLTKLMYRRVSFYLSSYTCVSLS